MAGHFCWHLRPPCGHLLAVGLKTTFSLPLTFKSLEDDSACHVSEEATNSARAAPLAILIGVAGTAGLGWILLIAASFATASVADVLTTTLPLPMGQLFLVTLGKRGMLIIWSFIIVVQVRPFMI
jgi:amino acid transporter